MCRIFALVGVELMFESLSRPTNEISAMTTPCFSHANGKFSDFATTSRVGYRTKALDSSNYINTFTTNFRLLDSTTKQSHSLETPIFHYAHEYYLHVLYIIVSMAR